MMKRRRLSSSSSLHINDLPDIILVKVSGYLAPPSRALFAVALTANSSDWKKINWNPTLLLSWTGSTKKQPPSAARAIVSSTKWEVLDFADIEWNLAARLLDDDISAVLSCINAVKYLKKFSLMGLVNITGGGLAALHGSVVLQWICFKFVPPGFRVTGGGPLTKERIVLPILDSIISTPGNSLKYINLPVEFGTYGKESGWVPKSIADFAKQSYVKAFEETYKQHLLAQEFECTKCCTEFSNDDDYNHEDIQRRMCCECLNFFCTADDDDECKGLVTFCYDCAKHTCSSCVTSIDCQVCSETPCLKCRKQMQCEICRETVCEKCYVKCEHCNQSGCTHCLNFVSCQNKNCDKAHCGDCYKEGGTNRDVKKCDDYHEYCFDCRFTTCSTNWNDACRRCLREIGISTSVAAKLQEEKETYNEKVRKLNEENIRLSGEYNKLRSKMQGLKVSLDAALGE